VNPATSGGSSLRQAPRPATESADRAPKSAAEPPAWMSLAEVAAHVRVSLRKAHELRAAGLLPEPVNLGPRALRWNREELDAHIRNRAPRGGQAAPAQLSTDAARAKRAATRAATRAARLAEVA